MKSQRTITDFGFSLTSTDMETGEVTIIGRYGVWGDKGHWTGKHEVLACGDDLEALQAQYGPNLPVEFIGSKVQPPVALV